MKYVSPKQKLKFLQVGSPFKSKMISLGCPDFLKTRRSGEVWRGPTKTNAVGRRLFGRESCWGNQKKWCSNKKQYCSMCLFLHIYQQFAMCLSASKSRHTSFDSRFHNLRYCLSKCRDPEKPRAILHHIFLPGALFNAWIPKGTTTALAGFDPRLDRATSSSSDYVPRLDRVTSSRSTGSWREHFTFYAP